MLWFAISPTTAAIAILARRPFALRRWSVALTLARTLALSHAVVMWAVAAVTLIVPVATIAALTRLLVLMLAPIAPAVPLIIPVPAAVSVVVSGPLAVPVGVASTVTHFQRRPSAPTQTGAASTTCKRGIIQGSAPVQTVVGEGRSARLLAVADSCDWVFFSA